MLECKNIHGKFMIPNPKYSAFKGYPVIGNEKKKQTRNLTRIEPASILETLFKNMENRS